MSIIKEILSNFLQKLKRDFIKVTSSGINTSFNFLFSLFLLLILFVLVFSYLSLDKIKSSISSLFNLFVSFLLRVNKKLLKSKTPFNKVGLFLAAENKFIKTSLFIKEIIDIRFSLVCVKLFFKISILQNSS